MAHQKLTDEVRSILERSTLKGNVLTLPEQLDRPSYDAVMEVVKNCGGKWKKGTGHVFPKDAAECLGMTLETGVALDVKKVRQAFYTPTNIAEWLADMADLDRHTVFEPSAGHGNLVRACIKAGAVLVNCVEIDQEACAELRTIKEVHRVECADFLTLLPDIPGDQYLRIVMNPPFTRGADKKHIAHALKHWLRQDGVLYAITADKDMEIDGASIEILERVRAGAFKESGTNVATRFIRVTHA